MLCKMLGRFGAFEVASHLGVALGQPAASRPPSAPPSPAGMKAALKQLNDEQTKRQRLFNEKQTYLVEPAHDHQAR